LETRKPEIINQEDEAGLSKQEVGNLEAMKAEN
jgi:hypothetical protein